ncbi:MMPL family transporter [Goodfellowiella coeruleoviolacea]|uniref:MMPL family transporter n=1 Tax=Goodfellowiella coeruleoviolacea TaxID=334858 RepID=UPI000A6D493C|nr:MMPL family transporter [Goodfellowiella coeruleoviolacea]
MLFVVLGGAWGAGAFGAFTGGAGFDDPGAESTHADHLVDGPLGRHVTDAVVLYESDTSTVDDPAFADAVQQAVAKVPGDGIARIESYWSTGDAAFISTDRHATYVGIQFTSGDDYERVEALNEIKDELTAPGLTVRFGGLTAMTQQVNAQVSQDILLAEVISLPILVLLLIVIFRSAVAAALPLVVGIVVAVGSLAVLRVVGYFTDLSTFSVQVVTILGLGLAIDYALFMVNRFREELGRGLTVDAAIQRTMATAGRTVAFSGLTVAVSLACLIVFPSRFLLSMGYAGVATVLFAVISSLVLLPALLRFAGRRVNSLRIPLPRLPRTALVAADETKGRWYRTAHAVMRRPVASTVGIVVVLVALGVPFLGVNWARPGDWVLPVEADARVVTNIMSTDFVADPAKKVTVVVEMPGPADTAQAQTRLAEYAQRLDAVAGVNGAEVTGTYQNQARLTLGYAMDPQSREARTMVEDLRAQAPPPDSRASVTGMPASRVDIVNMVTERLPWMAVFVAVVSFVVLFLAFGSVTLPLKSVLMNLLSLSASFGAIKLIFQDGYLSGLLDFVPVGAVDVDFPILIVAIAFGLSMDYEVFLLSRVREQWVASGDVVESVALGTQRTAKIITSAALLLVVVVGGFLTSGITFMKMVGVGLVIAILVDATIVRGLLVPATMRLMGKWAWWSPAPLARWWSRHGMPEPPHDPTSTRRGAQPHDPALESANA